MRYLSVAILGLVVLAGCRGPVRVRSESDVTVTNRPVQDFGPLAEMPVVDEGTEGAKIALIDVDGLLINAPITGLGVMGENPVSVFREKLDRIAADPCYCAVIVRINSHGGGVTASDIMWRDLTRFKAQTGLPVIACLMDVGTGGAYYVSTAADHIVAHPTTVTGGIGVILNLYNLQDTLMQFNVLATPVKAGELIDAGSPVRTADEQARQMLQGIADAYHRRFREVVAAARPGAADQRDRLFNGRVMTATEARNHGLIDSIGYLDDAIEMARQWGDAPQARVVMLHRSSDYARSPYAVTPNQPIQTGILPLSIPGLERSQLPTFLYLWQPEPVYERRASGR